MELQIVIIDKHFFYNLVCSASRKLQGCFSTMSTEVTDFICLHGASEHAHNDAQELLDSPGALLKSYRVALVVFFHTNIQFVKIKNVRINLPALVMYYLYAKYFRQK